jgi:hypothetical protein
MRAVLFPMRLVNGTHVRSTRKYYAYFKLSEGVESCGKKNRDVFVGADESSSRTRNIFFAGHALGT